MDKNKILLAVIAILVIALIVLGAYIITTDSNRLVELNVTSENNTDNTTDVIMIDKDGKQTNGTVVGDDSPRNDTNTSNETYRVYNPQSDSYVTVIGEGYDAEVDRWYTYDTDGVRYYNTRIK
ncbi:MAG: hypothetical protein IJ258_11620 [Methanobrevibacter sp.]|uniref:hypothetical protein n=1 Tax=Methanobrevibacter sp. TaxID=66852 RepID=UPI0025E946F2|nr:hypothetical protein [Methanobrevibacter sp.]MBQ8018727.1 hypothetical protein [Methanobrevibacter sp.]